MKKKDKKILKVIIIIFLVVLVLFFSYYFIKKIIHKDINVNIPEESKYINVDYEYYFKSVAKMLKDKKLYTLENDELKEIGIVSNDVVLKLEKDNQLSHGYFKIKDTEFYIDYQDIEASEDINEDISWKNYIPYNESIRTSDKTNLYLNDKLIFTINIGMELPIIIKEENYYGVIYKDKLYYIKHEECETFQNVNTELKHTNAISALVYHATYDSNNSEEKQKCINNNATICLSDIQFDEQMKYLVDNNFYTATMNDLEKFIDSKVQLPEHTVVITIDDGYFADASVKVLEKYKLHATLFLIGALEETEWKTDAWYSSALELHSHTYNMHGPNVCLGGQGSALKCTAKETLLADLQKSREQLNGSTVFCYPFFEYNDYAISVLKEAGFTMAFAGGRQKIKVGSNKMTLSRYGIINTTNLNDF